MILHQINIHTLFMSFLLSPWPWYVSGTVIAAIMFLLLFFGKSFGFSSNLRTLCAMGGAGQVNAFFDFNWKAQTWNLVFLIGAIIGGWIARHYLSDGQPVQLSEAALQRLQQMGFRQPSGAQPEEIFSLEALLTLKGFLILAIGGFLVGFGSRYAGGCTSGHAISGLSDLQLPSLIAVIGFFAGGLVMTWFIYPILFP